MRYVSPEEFSKPFGEIGWRAYQLELVGRPVATYYTGPDTNTLSWPGSIEFDELYIKIARDLPTTLVGEKRIQNQERALLNATTVTLLDANEADDADALEFHLGNERQFEDYLYHMRKPKRVAFVRYDVQASHTPVGLEYSFTADNTDVVGDATAELALALPKYYLFPERFLNWMANHYRDSQLRYEMQSEDELSEMRQLLQQLSRGEVR